MRTLRMRLLLVAAALTACAPRPARTAPAALPPGIVYASPLPGARWVSPRTVLLLRCAAALPAGADLAGSLHVVGAASGAHAGSCERLEGGTLVRFTPASPFAPGEAVTVALAGALAPDGAASYAFEVARSRPALPALALAPERGAAGAGGALPRPAAADTLPLGFPAIQVTQTGGTAPGRLFLASFPVGQSGDGYLMIVDDDGRVDFERAVTAISTDFKLQPDGRLSYFDGGAGMFLVLDSTFTVVDSVHCADGYATDLHELRLLPDGHALLMGDDPEVVDMSQVVPGGDPEAVVLGLVIQELDGGGAPVFEWRSWDHFAITDATHEDLTASTVDYVHGNALELDADGNVVLSSRHMDEITKIDRRTGDILWRWGGLHNQFAFLGDTLAFSHQHAVRRLADGDWTLFDNGNYHAPPFSRAVEYALDETSRTARAVWEYRASPDIYGSAMGYVQRLPNGNTLIGWGLGKPDVIEVDSLGHPVLTLSLPANVHSYRAYRFDWSPTDQLADEAVPAGLSLVPEGRNPFARAIDLVLDLPASGPVSLAVYDVQGREVLPVLDRVPHSAGVYRAHVDLAGHPAGVYFCRLAQAGRALTRRVVLLP